MLDRDALLKAAAQLLQRQPPLLDSRELNAFVQSFLERRDRFLRACGEHGSPLYVIDDQVLLDRARQFRSAFLGELPDVRVYYAVKSNNHPAIARALVGAGLGLDTSSGRELELALKCGSDDILLSGPGKTQDELSMAVLNRDRVTVLMDSFGELARLEQVAAQGGAHIRAGVRLTTDERGLWRKFGIPLSDLPKFLEASQQCNHVLLRGLQFHTSWNLEPGSQVRFIGRLGAALRELKPELRSIIEFVDIGGGYWPPQGEWLQAAGTPAGPLLQVAPPASKTSLQHYRLPSTPLTEFARQIGQAVRAELFPSIRCRICTEPGRWLCNDVMHILLTVVDRKADDLVITDGGTNAIGWERFESDYFPVINLSRPGLTEHACYVMGSLCTPHDLWGYGYWGQGIEEGDILLVPTQGAYTYSLRQDFIKPLPKAVVVPNIEEDPSF